MHTFSLRLAVAVLAACSALPAALAATQAGPEQVRCQYTYGGETRTHTALPSAASPYGIKAVDIGSFFHFRIVFEDRPADGASVKVYTYADRDDGPLLIHQATFPYPPPSHARARYGFSGLQSVYEPMRDGELQYWCELAPSGKGRP